MTLEALELREIEALELNAKAMLISNRSVLPHDLAAVYCGISEYCLLQMARDREIQARKNGKMWYFQKSDLDGWMSKVEEAKPKAKPRRTHYGTGQLPI
ncbi:MAG: helix-turn-helix domain-containing protein [Candidatus Fibromonas sp.]|jgi:excisionase family DNA binding protein|nr:helix-turn-helix domain-containing protein [Candidatus Fibromonas sp.]